MVSSHASVTYGVAKVLTTILKPLFGKSSHHVHSTQDSAEQANKVTLLLGECLSSYDITALFISVPVDPALGIIKDLLEKDNTLKEGTVLPVKDMILSLEFCLNSGSPLRPIVANLYMEYFEQKALITAPIPSKYGSAMWMTLKLSKGKK